MKSFLFLSESPQETIAFGAKLAKCLRPGMVVGLVGGLGSGKTTLIQGIASGLGVQRKEVKSPTFVIFHIYKGRFPVYHFDLYRLEKTKELEVIGFDEFVSDPEAVALIEWAERGESLIPADYLEVRLKHKGEAKREFKIAAHGPKSQQILKAL